MRDVEEASYAYAGQKHAGYCVLRLLATSDYVSNDFPYLIANHGQELPVLVLRRWCCHIALYVRQLVVRSELGCSSQPSVVMGGPRSSPR
jgi:hypothetical protein